MASQRQTEAAAFGKFAEEKVAQHYLKNGYAILERNWRMGKTEIDIIAQRDNTLVLIEVKARSGEDEDPLDAVTNDKRRRMMRAADTYLKSLQGDFSYRFDEAAITGTMDHFSMEILEDAFVASDLF